MLDSYAQAGVSIDANNRTTDWIKSRLRHQQFPQLVGGVGGFSGLWDLQGYRRPVLAASTDSIGTKVKVAIELKRYGGLGFDIVNHCVNDVLVSGATPLFFLDYLGVWRNEPVLIESIVGSIAEACEAAEIALLGGETAEMPALYREGDFDLAGTVIGAAEPDDLLRPDMVRPGDVLIGLPSNGLHTNGYTLVRRLLPVALWEQMAPRLGSTYGDALLAPHTSYVRDVARLRSECNLHGLAHITGGGLTDNVPRALPDGTQAWIKLDAMVIPPLFQELVERGGLSAMEALHTFNLGVGMVAIVAAEDAQHALTCVQNATVLGEIKPSSGSPAVEYSGQLRL